MTEIKICGITDLASGIAAIDSGASYLGFVFYPPSHRALEPSTAAQLIRDLRAARPAGWAAVGVFVNEPLEVVASTAVTCGLDVVQLNGEEPPEYIRRIRWPVFKAIRVSDGASESLADAIPSAASLGAERILLDANVPGRYGGTGVTYRWTDLGRALADGFLAGGLTPENVATAIALVHPWGVDVSSGVERDRRKDPALIAQFAAAVKRADAAETTSVGALEPGSTPRRPSVLRSQEDHRV